MSVAHRQLLSLAHRRLLQQSRLNTAKVFTRRASSKPPPELEDPALRVDNLRVDGTSRVERSRGPVTWGGVILAIAGGTAAWAWYDTRRKKELVVRKKQRTIGKIDIGGDFTLQRYVDTPDGGKVYNFSTTVARGKWMLLYFGFSKCPDICVTEMTKIAEVIKTLKQYGKKVGKDLLPIFVSIDPGRDSPKVAHDYAKKYNEEFIGLTGTEEMVKKAAQEYRVYVQKSGEGDDYLMDHSIITYLVSPEGEVVDFYTMSVMAPEIAARVLQTMADWQPSAEEELE